MTSSRTVKSRVHDLATNRSGSVGIIACFALPVLFAIAGAALDYARMTSSKAELQKAADAAAIATTRELGMSSIGDENRIQALAKSVVAALLGSSYADSAIAVEAKPNAAKTGIEVTVKQDFKPSGLIRFVGGDKPLSASASAKRVGTGKMCVLILSEKKQNESEVLKLEGASQITGQDCGIFSNSTHKEGINSKDNAILKADLICSSGGFKLSGEPAARYVGDRRTDCPPVDNPLKDRPEPKAGPCSVVDALGKAIKLVIETSRILLPGTYCGGIEIKGKDTVVTMQGLAGNNVIIIKDGTLKVGDDAKLYGRGVGFAFLGDNANFEFTGRSTIDLHAPTDGPLAGILFYGSRSAPDWREYKITSDNARVLVGTIYLPRGFLNIDAKNPVADQSAYTAIVVNELRLKDSPKLVLNTNYHQTKVPVSKNISQMGQSVQVYK